MLERLQELYLGHNSIENLEGLEHNVRTYNFPKSSGRPTKVFDAGSSWNTRCLA